jgi:hypothetical protein
VRAVRNARLLPLLALLAADPAAAAGIACHCFQDREYDAANPAKSDEYLLATAANTLLSAAYGVAKGEIVRSRMSGTPGDDLWVGIYAADRQRSTLEAELAGRAAAGSWSAAFKAQGGPLAPLGMRFMAAIPRGAGDPVLARLAAAETLAARLGTPWTQLDELERRGASLQETVLAALLARWSGRTAPEVLAEARGGAAWSALLARASLAPKDVGAAIPKAIGAPEPAPYQPPR